MDLRKWRELEIEERLAEKSWPTAPRDWMKVNGDDGISGARRFPRLLSVANLFLSMIAYAREEGFLGKPDYGLLHVCLVIDPLTEGDE